MKQFTLGLDDNALKPIVILENMNNFHALLDTGAVCPVWTDDESSLQKLGGRYIKEVSFGGFGGRTKGNLYVLPQLLVGDLTYVNLHIIACNELENEPFQLILGATMFQNLIYEIDDKHHKLRC